MSIDLCKTGPCPFLKTTSVKLPQQPFRCYNCQQRQGSSIAPKSPLRPSCTSSVSSTESTMTRSSTSSYEPTITSTTGLLYKTATAPLPGVAVQPAGTIAYCHNAARSKKQSSRPFSFACSAHWGAHYYASLPSFLPHQNHPCPPCQLDDFKQSGDAEAIAKARSEFPHLTSEMLVRNGQIRENWQSNLTLDKYIDEKRVDERQMWHHVIRKWTQDLKGLKILIAEEDGLGLLL